MFDPQFEYFNNNNNNNNNNTKFIIMSLGGYRGAMQKCMLTVKSRR